MREFEELSPVIHALLAGCFTWAVTALGASVVFFTRNFNRKILDAMLGFAGGVMIAASFWSLLAPAIEMSERHSTLAWFPAASGFLLGAISLRSIDSVLPHLHPGYPRRDAEGIRTSWHRSILLALAITMHNIPEGLAVGVAFGGAAMDMPSTSLAMATALALGIGIQNFPEGVAVAMPLRREGLTPFNSFWYGQISGVVEPLAAMLGAAVVMVFEPALPYALSFAAGAMIFVVVEEVIPESQRGGNPDLATMSAIAGFLVMMILDVSLG